MKDFFRLLGRYFFIGKKDSNAPTSKWTGYMHGINRLSIFLFLMAMVILVIRYCRKQG